MCRMWYVYECMFGCVCNMYMNVCGVYVSICMWLYMSVCVCDLHMSIGVNLMLEISPSSSTILLPYSVRQAGPLRQTWS